MHRGRTAVDRAWWLLALALLAPAPAQGSNPELTPMSAEAALTANAVLAGDDPVGGGWYNPASLGGIRGSSLQLGASAYSVATTRLEGALVTVLPWGTSSSDAVDVHYVSVPSVLSLSYKLGEGLGLAVGVWTPFHSTFTGYIAGGSSGPYPGYPGIEASYQQSYGLSFRWDDTWAGASVGWQALPWLRLGASVQGAYSSQSATIDLDTSLKTTSTDPQQTGAHFNVSVRGDDTLLGARAVVGLQADVTPAFRLALVLRSPAIRVVTRGQVSRVSSVAALLPGFAPQEGQRFDLELPPTGVAVVEVGRIFGGAAWSHGPWSVRFDVDWGPELQRAVGGLRANWNFRAGFLYQVDPDLAVGAGVYHDSPRGKASDGTLALDAYGVAGGIDFRPAKVVKALGGGESWDLLTGIAVRVSYGVGKGPGMTIVPFDLASSVVPIFPGQEDQPYQEVPIEALEGSINFFTALRF